MLQFITTYHAYFIQKVNSSACSGFRRVCLTVETLFLFDANRFSGNVSRIFSFRILHTSSIFRLKSSSTWSHAYHLPLNFTLTCVVVLYFAIGRRHFHFFCRSLTLFHHRRSHLPAAAFLSR